MQGSTKSCSKIHLVIENPAKIQWGLLNSLCRITWSCTAFSESNRVLHCCYIKWYSMMHGVTCITSHSSEVHVFKCWLNCLLVWHLVSIELMYSLSETKRNIKSNSGVAKISWGGLYSCICLLYYLFIFEINCFYGLSTWIHDAFAISNAGCATEVK